ncbi:heavy metal-associated isoprenylated plant protein 12-like [Neltuma alba]|uniref:heavy metal-associated isoprenylated plant protein 12-like n=1 Tax=Neltuma alba TaxID=207710 RepID=UPI0010A54D99|nr:heavy metal-associated isoprenylated plant protein 12-like [Prosopis alba]
MTMKKIVLKVELHGERTKQKAMKTTSGISGVESVNMDMKDKKLTVTGDIDPVKVVEKLRKLCHTEIVSVGEAKESDKKAEEKIENIAKAIVPALSSYSHVYYPQPPYYVGTVEEYPNSGCVIC